MLYNMSYILQYVGIPCKISASGDVYDAVYELFYPGRNADIFRERCRATSDEEMSEEFDDAAAAVASVEDCRVVFIDDQTATMHAVGRSVFKSRRRGIVLHRKGTFYAVKLLPRHERLIHLMVRGSVPVRLTRTLMCVYMITFLTSFVISLIVTSTGFYRILQ